MPIPSKLLRTLNMFRNLENWPDYLLYKYGFRAPEPLLLKCKNGITAVVPGRLLPTFKEIFFDECYSRRLPRVLPDKEPPVILDIGANAGYFSLYAASRYPGARIIAFEPMPNNFRALRKNVGQNRQADITAVNKAVSDSSGTISLFYDRSDSFTTAASINEGNMGVPGSDKIEVGAISLPDIVAAYGLSKIDLLKMDCEGAEYRILYNCPEATLARIGAIALESHRGPEPGENEAELSEYLRKRGFHAVTDSGDLIWAWRA